MNIKSILFPADFSKSSEAALVYASSLAAELGAKMYILHVGDESTAYLAAYGGFAPVPDLSQQIEKQNRAALEQTKPTLPDVEYEHRYLTGTADKQIVDFANQENIDMIVMGTHGRSGVSRLLMGSVAEGVLRHANCPVLTVKQPATKHPGVESAEEPTHKGQPGPHTKLSLH